MGSSQEVDPDVLEAFATDLSTMSTNHCAECGTAGAKMHCGACKVIFYCSQACQSALRPFMPVEMAIERTKGKMPKIQAPKDLLHLP